MSDVDFIIERLNERGAEAAIFWRSGAFTGEWIASQVKADIAWLTDKGVGPGTVVVLLADYSPRSTSLLLALAARNAIFAPLLPATLAKNPELANIVGADVQIRVDDGVALERQPGPAADRHPLVRRLQDQGRSGLVLFTSGSTGAPKGVLHDFGRLLTKFHKRRPTLRTLNFLLFDHWGGLNTLLHCLANGSPVVLPENRNPDYVCALLEDHRVELLPASPTFLNLLLLSGAHLNKDLSSLRLITYGSEPMPATTLTKLGEAFPKVELRQTYGLIELGVLRAKSESSNSLWVKVGGEGYDLRVVDGILQIKADSAMLGYLNADSPFTDDGYFVTGDRVEINGDYMRFLGRDSELINVGGQKVFPVEVETVLLGCDLVKDAVVYGEKHPLTGKIVCADIQLKLEGDENEARRTIKRYCSERLESFKVPVKLRFVTGGVYSDRLKRIRVGR
jgi:long-chain acyl-CoA synthetase